MNQYIEINIPVDELVASITEFGQDTLLALEYAAVYTLKLLLFGLLLIVAGISFLFMVTMLPTLWVDFWHQFVGDFWWAFTLVCVGCVVSGINLAVATVMEVEWLWGLISRINPTRRIRPAQSRSTLVIPQGTEGALA